MILLESNVQLMQDQLSPNTYIWPLLTSFSNHAKNKIFFFALPAIGTLKDLQLEKAIAQILQMIYDECKMSGRNSFGYFIQRLFFLTVRLWRFCLLVAMEYPSVRPFVRLPDGSVVGRTVGFLVLSAIPWQTGSMINNTAKKQDQEPFTQSNNVFALLALCFDEQTDRLVSTSIAVCPSNTPRQCAKFSLAMGIKKKLEGKTTNAKFIQQWGVLLVVVGQLDCR